MSTEECEKQCLEDLKIWVESQANFNARKDEEFLLLFLRGCKLDTDKTKKKMLSYYENRKRVPKWLANRNVDDLEELIQLKKLTLLIDRDSDSPSLIITQIPRHAIYDSFIRLMTILLEMVMRRPNCQKNGLVWIADLKVMPLWLVTNILNPSVMYHTLHTLFLSVPIRLKGVHVINISSVGRAAWAIAQTILPAKMSQRFHIYGSDWSGLKANVDARLLPEEYEGTNRTMNDHEIAFYHEIHAFNQYLVDDEKYGF